ncbi:MAG: hypothetical protein Q8K79_00615, partial [Solirubrobacteraceae bacterium]|nr:hypothetical protein [Solirubrobacteraceae bacterium]
SLAIGQTKTCTVTNNDIAPVLTVVKHVVNDNGGTKSAADFSLTVDDPGTNPAPFNGAEAPGTDVAVDPGAYSVSEGAHDGYAVSYSADCTGTLAIGETKTCTVTNNDIAPVLTVVKHVVNDDGGTKPAADFSLTVDDPGTNPAAFDGAEAPGTDVAIDAGAYSVSEGAHDGYAVSYSDACTGTLAIGQTATCTVTNDDIAPVLTVVKHVVNDDGGTKSAADFSLTVDDPGTNPAAFDGAEAPGTDVIVDPGAYSVTEGAHDGYAVSYSAGCRSELAIGETKTCTVTNDDIAPVLTVIKHMINGHGGTKTAADFSLTVDDPGDNPAAVAGAEAPGTDVAVDPGAYSVTEGAHDGYVVSYSDDCTGTLDVGETKTCTVTNNDIAPELTVIKHVVNRAGSTGQASDFTMHVTGNPITPDDFAGAESPGVTKTLSAGPYDVSETGAATEDYTQSRSADCSGTLAIGDKKTCTITNTRKTGTITVVKDLIPSTDDGRFDLEVDSTVVKQDAADGGTGSREVTTGTHTVSEVAGSAGSLGNYAKGISCSNEQGGSGAGPIDVTVTDGAEITCTITNRRVLAQPVVVKAGDTFAYHGDTASYTFSVSNTGNSPLHDVHVADDKCPTVSSAPTSKTNDDGDELLDPIGTDGATPEVWVFTCSYKMGDHQANEANPVVNTATVTAIDELDRPVTDADQHATTLLHPAIALTKTGPATALAGSRVVYLIAATNTGDVAFAAPLVVVTDARCEAPPIRLSTGTDASPGSLDPGDTWQFGCAVQSGPGETVIHNVAHVDGTDVNGRHATAQATADTILAAPRQAVAANVGSGDPVLAPASAKLRGPTGCMARTAKVSVTGKRISRVTFTVDGRSRKVVTKANSAGRYSYSVSRAKLRTGTHRVRARVVYLTGSSAKAKTLVMTLNKCRRAVVKPVFTG